MVMKHILFDEKPVNCDIKIIFVSYYKTTNERKNLSEHNYLIENIDATVIAQRPKLLPYRPQMAENIARALGLDPGRVSVKATTEEGLGFTGTGQGISAQAITLLTEVDNYCYDREMTAQTGCGGCCPGGGCGR